MKIAEDFILRDDLINGEKDTIPIEIISGPYAGVVYKYAKLTFTEDISETEAKCVFEYSIIKTGKTNKSIAKLKKDKRFQEHISLILNSLLLYCVRDENEHRKDNSEELGEQ